MSIEKKTVLNRIEIDCEIGIVGLRFAKLIVEDGEELARDWHRTLVAPGADVDAQIAVINAHLVSMNKAPVEASQLDSLKSILPIVHTKDVIDAFEAKQAAAMEALKRQ